jgi:hypothetical protein
MRQIMTEDDHDEANESCCDWALEDAALGGLQARREGESPEQYTKRIRAERNRRHRRA